MNNRNLIYESQYCVASKEFFSKLKLLGNHWTLLYTCFYAKLCTNFYIWEPNACAMSLKLAPSSQPF